MPTAPARSVFVDTNVLVFATVATAPRHAEAKAKLDAERAAGAVMWTSRQVLREYVATVTRPQTYVRPLPPAAVDAVVRQFLKDFLIAEDGPQVTHHLLTLLAQVACGGKQVHDANIVATMIAYQIPELLTDNVADFTRFAHWITVVPIAPLTPPPPPGAP